MKPVKLALAVIFTLSFVAWGGIRIYSSIMFDITVGEHLKRAADANTVELAMQELKIALSYMEEHDMTSGYTSALYNSPSEDVGFWYQNTQAALGELEKVTPDTPQLVRSNLLLKLRETLLDHTQSGESVTTPDGISIFPNNRAFAWWAWLSTLLASVFWTLWSLDDGYSSY